MRQRLLSDGAKELSYEIRDIVRKANQLKDLGLPVYFENIGDPIQKNAIVPDWMRQIISDLALDNNTYGYCPSKGVPETREFLAERNNRLGGAQITAEDILFFNGLGDAIAKLYQFLTPTARIIMPSPGYSTHSSAEAAHAHSEPITYRLDPENHWLPDLEELYLKVKYNPNIVGILIINPDNPTGMVYPREVLDRMIAIAKEFDLFIISDEIYLNITYNNVKAIALAEIIGEVPGISLKGISKELPWPGSRCGWMEFYNRHTDTEFARLCSTLDNAKMIEVCATKLPQMAIPRIMQHPNYNAYIAQRNQTIGQRSQHIADLLANIPGITFNPTYGAFYNTIIFKPGVLQAHQQLHIADARLRQLRDSWLMPDMPLDKRFVYNLLAAKGVCVVPISSFCSDLQGFRVTLLEENQELLQLIFRLIKEGIEEYLNS